MKRKRYESLTIPNKVLCLQNGSNVEAQLDDGKWHSGTIIQCQTRKYLVEVDQQQYWIDFDLIRPNTLIDQKRNVPFEYRPGQFLRNETKSTNKIVSDEKVSSSISDTSLMSPSNELSNDLKRKRLSRRTNSTNEQKNSPFVWKPSTISTIQTRRSSRCNQSPAVSPEENQSQLRTLPNSPQQKSATNNVKSSTETTTSEVLIFRPIIRFVESAHNDEQTNDLISPSRHCSTDDENPVKQEIVNSRTKDEDLPELLVPPDLIYHINASTDSRSSSTTSTDNSYIVNQYDSNPSTIEQQIKAEPKSSCFLETPPPSLPDIHLAQESESTLDKPLQQLKSKRKQDRPQRKHTEFKQHEQGQQLNGVLDRLLLKQKDGDDLSKTSNDLCDPGYLSDEYSEPIPSKETSSTCSDLENFSNRLEQINNPTNDTSNNIILNDDDKLFYQQFINYIYNNNENYNKLTQYCLIYYNNQSNQRINLILNILQRIFSITYKNNSLNLFEFVPDEVKTHLKSCLHNVLDQDTTIKRRITTRGKQLTNISARTSKFRFKRNHITNTNDISLPSDQQVLLSPSSPSTPASSKNLEQPSVEDLLSPNHMINPGGIEEIPVLPKERDIYEIINCLCKCETDNGFMIQCELCLCWSHCECVGVTATCIPTFFRCDVCAKAEADRKPQLSLSTILEDELTSQFLTTGNNLEKISLFLSYCRRLSNLREQIIELKLRHTPTLRSLQYALRCDDLNELFDYANVKSDQLMAKIVTRQTNRQFFESVAQTIDHIVNSVCSSISDSSCLYIELKTENETKIHTYNDQMNVLISHLCDDEETRHIRSSIQNRYEHLMSTVDNKIQAILLEHRNIQTQMAFELGIIIPNNVSDDCLSYDTYESALKAAIDRLKC